MMKFIDYAYNSMVTFAIQLNPIHWFVFDWDFESFSELYPGKYNFTLRVLMFRLAIHLDDGTY